MYRIAICDDEPLFVEQLHDQIDRALFPSEIEYDITEFSDPHKLLAALDDDLETFHLLFLDIMMQDLNGIDLARILRKKKNAVSIIFITSSPSFALEGYSVRPVQYLLKPVALPKLKEALLYDYDQNFTRKRLMFSYGKKTYSLALKDITYIEIYGHSLKIHTQKETFESTGTLKEIERYLSASFLRCHRSYVVNLERIIDIQRYSFTLDSNEHVPIGKEKYQLVQQAFVSFAAQ